MNKYIGDVGKPLKGPSEIIDASFSLVLFSLSVGFVVGLLVWLVLWLSTFLTNLLWYDARAAITDALSSVGVTSWWLPLAFSTFGGLVIGLWTKFTNAEPESLDTVMSNVKQNGGYELEKPGASVVAFLLPLVFGGSVGPEAGLTGIIAAACTRVGDALKGAGLRVKSVADLTISAALAAVFATPIAGIVASTEEGISKGVDVANYEFKHRGKLVLYTSAALGAFGGILVFSSIFGGNGGIPRFSGASAGITELKWLVPCLLVGYAGAFLYHASNFTFRKMSSKLKKFVVLKPVLLGIVLGAIGVFLPFVFFPGEEQAFELKEEWKNMAAITLLLTGFFKSVASPACINFGWKGGNFFPCIFAGIALGYGIASFSGVDSMFCVCVATATLIAGIQRKPLMALAILLLCFPAESIIWIGLACIAGAYAPIPKKLILQH